MLGRKNGTATDTTIAASACQKTGFKHTVAIRHHAAVADEPLCNGGQDEGPSPQELLAAALASCTAITMEMYAEKKGWDLTGVEVTAQYCPPSRGAPTRFSLVLGLPANLTEEQVEKLRIIAAKCPVHRTLEGEVCFDERVQLI